MHVKYIYTFAKKYIMARMSLRERGVMLMEGCMELTVFLLISQGCDALNLIMLVWWWQLLCGAQICETVTGRAQSCAPLKAVKSREIMARTHNQHHAPPPITARIRNG